MSGLVSRLIFDARPTHAQLRRRRSFHAAVVWNALTQDLDAQDRFVDARFRARLKDHLIGQALCDRSRVRSSAEETINFTTSAQSARCSAHRER